MTQERKKVKAKRRMKPKSIEDHAEEQGSEQRLPNETRLEEGRMERHELNSEDLERLSGGDGPSSEQEEEKQATDRVELSNEQQANVFETLTDVLQKSASDLDQEDKPEPKSDQQESAGSKTKEEPDESREKPVEEPISKGESHYESKLQSELMTVEIPADGQQVQEHTIGMHPESTSRQAELQTSDAKLPNEAGQEGYDMEGHEALCALKSENVERLPDAEERASEQEWDKNVQHMQESTGDQKPQGVEPSPNVYIESEQENGPERKGEDEESIGGKPQGKSHRNGEDPMVDLDEGTSHEKQRLQSEESEGKRLLNTENPAEHQQIHGQPPPLPPFSTFGNTDGTFVGDSMSLETHESVFHSISLPSDSREEFEDVPIEKMAKKSSSVKGTVKYCRCFESHTSAAAAAPEVSYGPPQISKAAMYRDLSIKKDPIDYKAQFFDFPLDPKTLHLDPFGPYSPFYTYTEGIFRPQLDKFVIDLLESPPNLLEHHGFSMHPGNGFEDPDDIHDLEYPKLPSMSLHPDIPLKMARFFVVKSHVDPELTLCFMLAVSDVFQDMTLLMDYAFNENAKPGLRSWLELVRSRHITLRMRVMRVLGNLPSYFKNPWPRRQCWHCRNDSAQLCSQEGKARMILRKRVNDWVEDLGRQYTFLSREIEQLIIFGRIKRTLLPPYNNNVSTLLSAVDRAYSNITIPKAVAYFTGGFIRSIFNWREPIKLTRETLWGAKSLIPRDMLEYVTDPEDKLYVDWLLGNWDHENMTDEAIIELRDEWERMTRIYLYPF